MKFLFPSSRNIDYPPDAKTIVTQESTAPGHYRWYVVALLMGIYACQTLDRNLLNMMFESIKHEFGLSDSQLGMLAGIAFAVPNAITAIPLGILTDRVNRTRLLAIVVSIWSALTAFSGLASSYLTLLIARAGVGAMEAGCAPNAISLTADYFPPRQRSGATAAVLSGGPLGLLIGFAVGGIIASHYSWRTAFFIAGIPGIALSLLVLFTVREPHRGGTAEPLAETPSLRTTLAFIKSQKSLLHLICAVILLVACTAATNVWATSYLMRFHSMPIRNAGIVLAIGLGVFGFFGTAAGGQIADRMGNANPRWQIKVPAIAITACAVLWSAMLLSTTKSGAVIFLSAWAFFNIAWLGPVYGLIVTLVEPRMRGTTTSLTILLSNGIGTSLGPQVVGYISDQLILFAGNQSLRYALFAPVLLYLWGVWHFYAAAHSIETDLSRVA